MKSAAYYYSFEILVYLEMCVIAKEKKRKIHVEVQMGRMTKIHGVPSAHFLKYCIPRYI